MPLLERPQTPQIGQQFYELLPHRYRMHDHSPRQVPDETEKIGFHKRFMRIFGDVFDAKLTEYAGMKDVMNPLKCPEAWLGHLSATLGLPLDPRVPEDTARLLVDHLQSILRVAGTDRCIRLLCYALTGISVRIYTPNGKSTTVMAQHVTHLVGQHYPGDLILVVDDVGSFQAGDRVTVVSASKVSRQIITDVVSNMLFLKDDLNMVYTENALVIRGEPTHRLLPGVWGDKVAIAGQALPNVQIAIDMPRAQYCDPERGSTVYIEWHHWPSDELLDITSDLIEELAPGQLHINHISEDHVYFIAGLSVAGGRECAGGG